MATKESKPAVSAEVDELFTAIENFVAKEFHTRQPYLKLQVEKDFRGRPVLAVRIRKEDVEPELMPTLRYPE